MNEPLCPHDLLQFSIDEDYHCSECFRPLERGERAYGCRECDYDQCAECNVLRANISDRSRKTNEEDDFDGHYSDGPSYWNNRYEAKPEPFEWLHNFKDVDYLVLEVLRGRKDAEVLNVGCGNSTFTEDIYDMGYVHITNIDVSVVAVEQMKARNVTVRPSMKWLEMDATQLSFPDRSFDAVLDKATLDTMACGEDASLAIGLYLQEVQRVLRPGGACLIISFAVPSRRAAYFKEKHLHFDVREITLPSHFAYILTMPAKLGMGEASVLGSN